MRPAGLKSSAGGNGSPSPDTFPVTHPGVPPVNVIDLRTADERMAPIDFVLTPFEKSEAAVYMCEIHRQRVDRNAIDQTQGPRPAREQWTV